MDHARMSALAHADHPISAPLSEASVARVLDRALSEADRRILDLGCGEGAWLLRAVQDRADLRGEGVDVDAAGLARARDAARARGLADRLSWLQGDAAGFVSTNTYDVVLCVGATHAFGGLLPTLAGAGRHVRPGGVLVLGDGFWERAPTVDTIAAGFAAEEFTDLAGTVAAVAAQGWAVVYGHVSTAEEWDDYEWSWTGSSTRWALDHPEDPDSPEVLAVAAAHRGAWLTGWRGVLGFLTLVLMRAPDAG